MILWWCNLLSDLAAVGILLRHIDDGLYLLFIKRKAHYSDPWSGHIAFPGGHYIEEDRDLYSTVVREVLEEVGINLDEYGRLLDVLPSCYPLNKPVLKVYPYVFYVFGEPPIRKGVEVEEYYWVPIYDLSLVSREVSTGTGLRVVDAYVYRLGDVELVIWGLTKRILDILFKRISEYNL
jgi:8-oxo-dGTP pyrophosphatase MutT (NUDIX family)